MIGSKNQGVTKPTALGTLLASSTYGATIPVGYGLTLGSLYPIWAANLRQGPSDKKLKNFLLTSLGGTPTYMEAIDFLIGHNPVMGVMQMWNNGSPIPLNFISVSLGGAGTQNPYVISDSNFYALIAVTISVAYSGVIFNDYGGGGPQNLSGTYEIPCWNTLHAGPKWNSGQRYFPFTYRWEPSFGATFYLDGQNLYPSPGVAGTVKAYYAQLKAATSFLPPLQKERLIFEPELGSGPEYADANLVSQQIVYPMFAGLGSPNIDLGVGGVLPNLQAEVQWKWGIYPTGDADFVDMIEDIFRSGVAQAAIGANQGTGVGFTAVEHGLSAYDFPGCVQNQYTISVSPLYAPLPFNQNNTQGNFLVVIAAHGWPGFALNISDTFGNDWTPVLGPNLGYQVWWAQAKASGPNSVTVNASGSPTYPGVQMLEVAGVDTFDSATVGTSPSVAQPATNQQGFPAYLLTVSLWAVGSGSYNLSPNISSWKPLNAPSGVQNADVTPGYNAPDQLTFERIVKAPGTYAFTMPQISFNPNDVVSLAFKCAVAPALNPAPVGDFIDQASFELVRQQDRANGLWGSLTMDSQQAASNWIDMLCQAGVAAPLFMGFKFFLVPKSEVSAVGNGATYYAPTACGPVDSLSTETGDILSQGSAAGITVQTATRVDQPNVLQMQCIDRNSNYAPSVVSQPDAASISLFGVRKKDPVVNRAIQDPSIARQILGVMVKNLQYGGDVYSFTMSARHCLKSPMDLILVSDPLANVVNIPVLLSSITEDANTGELQSQATPFIYGMNAPLPFATDGTSPFQPNPGVSIAPVNAPVIFEPVPGLIGNANQGEIWLVISDPDPNYGGAQVYISTDGGASYNPAGNPIVGNGVTGYTVNDWPAAPSPDTANNLSVDLTESQETLQAYSIADEDGFLYPCYVQSASSGPTLRGSMIKSQGATSNSISLPLPPGCQVGDLAIVFAAFGYPVSVPGGWTVLYYASTSTWNALAISKPLNSTDISLGFVNIQNTTPYLPYVFDMSAGIVVFAGPTGGVRETQGQASGGGSTVTNTTSGAVASGDVGLYWATDREDGHPTLPVIAPAVGAANTLQNSSTVNSWSVLADQTMPGGVLAVNTTFPLPGGGNGAQAIQVIVQAAAIGQIPYELMTYAVANLTAPFMYTLQATGAGNHLNRGVFGAPSLGQGIDHPNNSRFALLPPSGQGIAKLPLLPAWIGKTVYFKIVPFNAFGVAGGTLADAIPYAYVVQGASGAGPQLFLVNGT